MSDRRISLLGDTQLSWFEILYHGDDHVLVTARVEETVWRDCGLVLLIRAGLRLDVGEQVPGTKLPRRCSERHIQKDSTFCLGLHPISVDSQLGAESWWENLRQYLWLQSVAHQTGVWPFMHYLDHGRAGDHHEVALNLASQLGMQAEYDAAYEGKPSWITDPRIRLADKTGRLINGRAPCPRGCLHPLSSVPKLRRNCSRRDDIARLAYHERKRRDELASFWKEEIRAGTLCCGTMRDCPLRQAS